MRSKAFSGGAFQFLKKIKRPDFRLFFVHTLGANRKQPAQSLFEQKCLYLRPLLWTIRVLRVRTLNGMLNLPSRSGFTTRAKPVGLPLKQPKLALELLSRSLRTPGLGLRTSGSPPNQFIFVGKNDLWNTLGSLPFGSRDHH